MHEAQEFNAGEFPAAVITRGQPGRLVWLCGYVGVPKGNKFFGLEMENPVVENLNVLGCVTFAGDTVYGLECMPDTWWLGFDSAHGYSENHSVEDMKRECRKLAAQLSRA